MSLTVGLDDIFLSTKIRQTSQEEQLSNVVQRRRRTVSTGFEQSRGKGSFYKSAGTGFFSDSRKTQSFAEDLRLAPKTLLRKISTLASFQEESESSVEEIKVDRITWLKQLPGFSIILNIIGTIVFQTGNVLVKNVEMDLMLMLFMRDIMITSHMVPATIAYGDSLPPRVKKLLMIVSGLIGGFHNMVHYYSVKVLPLGDVMMISAVKPMFITLLSCVFLKESCGLFEVLNLVLVLSGIVLVVQPPIMFGTSNMEYTSHMFNTAMVLMASNAIVSFTAIIARHLKDTHWSVLCLSSKGINMIQLFCVCIYRGVFCLPECGLVRLIIVLLSFIAYVAQAFYIICLQNEEAHIIGLSDNASNIIISQIFQIIFFSQFPKTLKIIGFLLVLSSMIMFGGKKIIDSRKKERSHCNLVDEHQKEKM